MDPNPQLPAYTQPASNSENFYPIISVARNQSPSRFWAIPLLGGLIKFLILIPQYFMWLFAFIVIVVFGLINVLRVLVTGTVWPPYYNWVVKFANLNAKVCLFSSGVLDKYPGFNFKPVQGLAISIKIPEKSGRIYAVPFLGLFIRFVFLVPFTQLANLISSGSTYMTISSSVVVLMKKYYPESTHELVIDSLRMSLAQLLYMTGITDKYPSFRISENHLGRKIFFVVLPYFLYIPFFFVTYVSGLMLGHNKPPVNYQNTYPYNQNTQYEFPSGQNYEDINNDSTVPQTEYKDFDKFMTK